MPSGSHGGLSFSSAIDHVAIEVSDFESHLDGLCAGGLRLIRRGVRYRSGQPIAMIGDGTGTKIELIGTAQPGARLAHIALRVDDVDTAYRELARHGWLERLAPHDLAAAQARSGLLCHAAEGGLELQVITYQPASPDMAVWSTGG
jgi:catechol 2,3-dioxygenase-like lactoylglutathione lyase family enzyme